MVTNLNSSNLDDTGPDSTYLVMLVDDQAVVAEGVRRLLADQSDMNFHYCSDPTTAVRVAESIRPTVLLLDLVMPEMDGLDLVRFLRADTLVANTPIIVLSSKEDAEIKSQAFQAGANDYLVKLPDKIELLARIRYHSRAYLNLMQRDEAFRALRESQQQLLATNTSLLNLNSKLSETVKARDAESEAREAAQVAMRVSDERFRQLAGAVPQVFWITGPDGVELLYASPAYEKLWQRRPGPSGSGEPWNAGIHEEDLVRVHEAFRSLAATGGFELEYRIVRRDGTLRWVKDQGFAVSNDVGDIVSITGIAEDITDHKRDQLEILHAREEAERANGAKSEFLSRMSHELRTPLNAILGFGQLLEMGNPTDEQNEYLGHILNGGSHLLALINEVLDIARIESGKIQLALETLDLQRVLQEALVLVSPLASTNRIQVVSTVESRTFVVADRQRVKQVLLNLLSNAVKYNRSEGTVDISSEVVAGRCRVSVADTGLGMSAADLQKLFTPFERLGATQTGIEGTGLGLTLSKHLVEAMGGVLSVTSVLGEGTVLCVDLPSAAAPEVTLQSTVPRPEPTSAEGQIVGTVLCIEDNIPNLRLIERIVQSRTGINLLTAMQGRIGLDLARQHFPDLILLDLHLPDVDGEEVLRRLQADPATRSIPVIILTAEASEGSAARFRSLGAQNYLTKPLNVSHFLSVLEEALSRVVV